MRDIIGDCSLLQNLKLPEPVSTRFRVRRAAVIELFAWNAAFSGKVEPKTAPKERREPLKLAHYYQTLLDSGKFENRAALARHLGVSRARVTQVLKRLEAVQPTAPAPQGDVPFGRP